MAIPRWNGGLTPPGHGLYLPTGLGKADQEGRKPSLNLFLLLGRRNAHL